MAVRVPAKKAAAASPRRHGTGQSNRREEPIAPTVLESWGHAPPQIVAPLSNRTKAPDASDPILANQEEHVLPLKAKNAREVSALQLLLKNGKRSSSAVGSVRSPHQKEATDGDDQVERTQRQQENELRGSRDPTTKIRVDRATSGHAAYVAEVLRQFFRARPRQVVIDTFRGNDANFNGRIERQEFLKTLKSLNLNLADKDFDALFRATDIDHSGTIEIDEFLNLLRVDALISSEPFFWHEARPRRLLTKKERLEMARELTQADRGEGVKMAPEEIMRLFQTRVSQRSMKSVYQLLDEDRSGSVETNEIVESLQRLRIHVTEEEARDLMESINKKLEPNNASRDKVAYSSFAAALQLDSMVRSELEARGKKNHVTCPDKVEEGWEDRQLKRTRNIHKHLIGGGERHDGALDVAEDAENHQYMPAGSRELHGDSMLFSGAHHSHLRPMISRILSSCLPAESCSIL
ncbi:hypothetical protein AB1Y20_020489 [Prymnesium parvum]|uniref:EF-hand domain-containing protein n=1 Tax=Prymnesium parvum TaxID=97485 RepID=A0AB34JUT7_PRYPA